MVIGAFVRGLSMRDVESLCEKAGLGKLSKSTASRICQELRERFEAFKRRDLYEVRVAALFLDATFLSVRPEGPPERREGRGTYRWGDRRRPQVQRGTGHLPHPPHEALEPVFAIRPSRIVSGAAVQKDDTSALDAGRDLKLGRGSVRPLPRPLSPINTTRELELRGMA